jgi:hypothetical protein
MVRLRLRFVAALLRVRPLFHLAFAELLWMLRVKGRGGSPLCLQPAFAAPVSRDFRL